MDSNIKDLTKAEEQIMHILWSLEKGFVKEVLANFPEPKPAYNTVSTIIRILQDKGFVNHHTLGKSHQYYPLISKEDYAKFTAEKLLLNYFNNSVTELMTFFMEQGQTSKSDLESIAKTAGGKKSKSKKKTKKKVSSKGKKKKGKKKK